MDMIQKVDSSLDMMPYDVRRDTLEAGDDGLTDNQLHDSFKTDIEALKETTNYESAPARAESIYEMGMVREISDLDSGVDTTVIQSKRINEMTDEDYGLEFDDSVAGTKKVPGLTMSALDDEQAFISNLGKAKQSRTGT